MAERKIKQKACKIKTNEPNTTFAELDTGEVLDLNVDLNFTWDERLTETQKRFIFYYTYPFDNSACGNGAESAKRAGYSEKIARRNACAMLAKPEISTEIRKIKPQYLEKVTKYDIKSKSSEIVNRKFKKIDVNIGDFYKMETVISNEGLEYTRAVAKRWDELTDEQKKLVEAVEYVGPKGIMNYKLPNKTETENEILKLCKEYCSDDDKKDDSGFDVDLTYNIIKDNIEVRTEIMKKNEEKLVEARPHFKYVSPEAAVQQER